MLPNNKKNIIPNTKKDNKISRRDFLSFSTLGLSLLFSTSALSQNKYKFNLEKTDFDKRFYKSNEIITPAPLKAGDSVAFAAPSSPVTLSQIKNYVNFFKAQGCNVIISDSIKKQKNNHRYLSNSDEIRASELNTFFEDPDIKAIICGRGGYGAIRILKMLNYDALRKHPKIIMGYSDITALLIAIYNKSGLVTYHGPVASSKLTNEHIKNIKEILFFDNTNNTNNYKQNTNKNKLLKYSIPDMRVISPGIATGFLQGGNLTLLSATFGTSYEINLSNSLLFVEDVSILAHDFDRMMHQLIISGKLDTCKGILFGKMKGLEKRGNFYPNRAYTILELMEQVADKLNLPVAYNFSFGHVQSDLILPIGAKATLNTEEKFLEIFVS